MRRRTLAVCGLVAATACTRPEVRPPAPKPAMAPAAREATAPKSDPAADAVVAEALALVSRVRELPVRAEVPGVRLDRRELQSAVEEMLASEAPAELVEGNTELLFALDTVPANFDLKATLTILYGAQLAGFYDPDKKRMVLAADLGEDAEELTLYHELVHALQDQHYDLGRALDWRPDQSDALAALHCLGEGDATSSMLDVFARAKGMTAGRVPPDLLHLDALLMQASPDLKSVPGIITRSLIAPYADGLVFVNALRERFPSFTGVDRAWRDRPVSTEQILHPDKYLAREPVVPIAEIPPPPGFGAAVFRDVLGEQSLRLLFEEWMPTRRAAESASDWGGDRFAIFREGDRRVVRWHLAFDTEPAAERALIALARGALRPELPPISASGENLRPMIDLETAERAARGGTVCQERPQRGAIAMVRHGRHVGVTLGPYLRERTSVRSAGNCPDALRLAHDLAKPR
ncbi:MAG TPA: DUF6782 family putative metallopeptidase [Polyangiaceae bacterium]